MHLEKNKYAGCYIAFEGIDGCGKTTQSKLLNNFFEGKGKKVIGTSEPRVDLPGGEDIMRYFRGEIEVPGQAFQYWMSANRVINQETIVIPALKRGEVVISDRCFWSAIPYGLMDKGVGFSRKEADLMLVTQSLLSHYYQFIVPDIVFYIDISSGTGLERSLAKTGHREGDVYEKKDKLREVVEGYRWMAGEFPGEFVVIDGERSVEEVSAEILGHLSNL